MTILISYILFFSLTTVNALYRRFVIKKKDGGEIEQIHFAFEILAILVIGSVIMQFFSPLYFTGDLWHLVIFSVICGVCGMGYFALNFAAQKYVDAGISQVIVHIYVPITIIFSSILLNEGLNKVQLLGTGLLLVSMFIISKKHQISRFRFDRYFWLMILSGFCMGVLLIAERALQKQTGLTAGTMLSWGSQFAFLGVLALILKSKHTYTNKEVITTGALQLVSSMSYVVMLFTVGNLSFVSSITTFKIVFIFIGAAIFLHEREDLSRKIFGSAIAVIGLLLMK